MDFPDTAKPSQALGIWGAFEGTDGHPAAPISIPSCFASLINPLIPLQVSFNLNLVLANNLNNLTLLQGVNVLHWLGPRTTSMLDFPLHADPSLIRIRPSSATGLC